MITMYYALTILYIFLAVPSAPSVIPEECSAEQNTVTVSWQTPEASSTAVDGYILELAEAVDPEFRVRRKVNYYIACFKHLLCAQDHSSESLVWNYSGL